MAPPTLYPYSLPRDLSADGSRVFFETEEALLAADSNSVMDVYEWEREGAGSCVRDGGGCLYLISSGVSSEPSYFAQASSSGGDVFFFTRQSLVGQDEDELVDLYDAREGRRVRRAESTVCAGAVSRSKRAIRRRRRCPPPAAHERAVRGRRKPRAGGQRRASATEAGESKAKPRCMPEGGREKGGQVRREAPVSAKAKKASNNGRAKR